MEKDLRGGLALPIYQPKHDQPLSNTCCRRSRRSLALYATAMFFIIFTMTYGFPVLFPRFQPELYPGQRSMQSNISSTNRSSLVPLEAHIMSKCPDAKMCLEKLVVPTMQQVVDKVDFRLSYIGKIDKDDTIHCMHGPDECLGNMLGLCANDLFPTDPKISLGFSTCLTMSYQRIPSRDLVENCALEHGLPFDDLNACISEDGKGLDLLEASVKRSELAGVKKSCTVRLDGEQWCVMDGGEWRDCKGGHEVKDLVAEVERIYKAK